jgi:hypothetical protein
MRQAQTMTGFNFAALDFKPLILGVRQQIQKEEANTVTFNV